MSLYTSEQQMVDPRTLYIHEINPQIAAHPNILHSLWDLIKVAQYSLLEPRP